MSTESHAQPDSRTGRIIGIVVVVLAVVVGAGALVLRYLDDDSGSSAAGIDKVTYLTGFDIAGHESYVHVARDRGYFAEAGIEVTIKPGQAGPYNDKAIISGQADFAAVDSSGALVRFAKTDPADRTIRIVACVQYQTLVSLVSLEDEKITAPSDLVGKKIGVAPGAAPKVLWPLYAKNSDVDPNAVDWSENQPKALAGLLVAGQVDAVGLYVASVPGVEAAEAKAAKAAGRPIRKVSVLPYSDVLPDMPGTVLITNQRLIERDPDLVRRFTNALMRGLEYTVDHSGEAADILHKSDPKYVPAVSQQQVELMAPYARPPAGRPFGYLEPEKVARAIALLQNIPGVQSFMPGEIVDFAFVPGADGKGGAR